MAPRPIIAFDFDDVICDITSAFLNFYNDRYGTAFDFEKIGKIDLYIPLGITEDEENARWNEFFKNPSCYPAPANDLHQTLSQLKNRFDVVILTARSSMWHYQIEHWIARYMPNIFDRIIYTSTAPGIKKEKGVACREEHISVLIDDDPANIASCVACGVKVVVFDQLWNRDIPETVPRIKSLHELATLSDLG